MTEKYIYNNYLKNISSKYEALLGDISANYNFDLGTEFELVVCEILQKVLPNKFGVCRGFLVSKDGQLAGDDIIIYDRIRFPQIRLFDENDLAHKQEVPIEAAYAYIEVKNSLIKGDGNSFEKSLMQVSTVKKLVSSREPISISNAFSPYISIDVKSKGGRNDWPKQINPFFTAVMAPNVKSTKNEIISDPEEVITQLVGEYDHEYSVDLIVAGRNVCFLPFIKNDNKVIYRSPFNIEDSSILRPSITERNAFSVGMCSLLYALDTICLGIMPWPAIIADAINIEVTE